jgi:hypothetical protein
MNHLRGRTTRGTLSLEPFPIVRSMSNKERGGPLERTPDL